jgi:SAM-dependent methyltransferase
MYPIVQGLPVMLPYRTALHERFHAAHKGWIDAEAKGYRFAAREPVPGETFVLRSFSTEWLAYDYDGVIWEMDYSDHERRFLAELGEYRPAHGEGAFLELGCGIGITTALAQKNFGGDAIGVDLSLAAQRAAARYRDNPFLHFVQGSVFYLPFEPSSFDTIYSRGVLHHTFSTEKAFRSLARYAKPGGALYLWVYGPKSINDNPFRRGVYVAERLVRDLLSGGRSEALSTVVLAPLAVGYVAFNRVRRAADPTIQPYNYRRALHAARDRFTPEFAHRHDHDTVMRWFAEAGFESVEAVDWRAMPTADHDDYRRNTGVRGRMRVARG